MPIQNSLRRPAIARYGTGENERLLFDQVALLNSAPMNADAILAAFRGVQARGEKLTNASVDRIMAGIQKEIGALKEPEKPTSSEVKQLLPALRVLNALLAMTEQPSQAKGILNQQTLKILMNLVAGQRMPTELRIASADALLQFAPEQSFPHFASFLRNRSRLLTFAIGPARSRFFNEPRGPT